MLINIPVGKNIGSALIDFEMEASVRDRLLNIPAEYLEGSAASNAQSMMRGGRFERFKCAFGSDVANVSSLRLRVPGLTHRDTFAHLDITNGSMAITT
jgi:hypothetical protein